MKHHRDKEGLGPGSASDADAVTAQAQAESGADNSQAWYVAEGKRGQQLLDQGQVDQAAAVFESILTRLGDAPSYGRALILGRLGRCSYMGGRHDLAIQHGRAAIDVIGRLTPSNGVKVLRGALRSELGDALRARGNYDEARQAYESALKISEDLQDLRGQAVDLARLGALALTEGKLEEALARQQAARRLFQQFHDPDLEAAACHQLGRIYSRLRQWDEAERHYQEAARISEDRGHMAAAAQTWNQLAVVAQETGKADDAEQWYRKVIAVDRQSGNVTQLGQHLNSLADLLQKQPGRLVDASQLAGEVALNFDPSSPEVWRSYGILADIIEHEARTTADAERRRFLEMEARDHRELQRQVPIIFATLARVDASPGYGRAVILGQVGRCLAKGRRPDLGVAFHREAIGVIETLATGDRLKSLHGALQLELGDMLRALGLDAESRNAHEASLRIAEELQDVRGQAHASQRLGRAFQEERRNDPSAFAVRLYEDLTTQYVFEPDLLVDGPREQRIIQWNKEAELPADIGRPLLQPFARTWMDEGWIRFSLAPGEPIVERHPGCTVVRQVQRDLAVLGDEKVLWSLIRWLDGTRTIAEILSTVPESQRAMATQVLTALVSTGIVDVSGRPFGRFLHSATKKGVLPAGGLEGDEVLHLATDGGYRAYPEAPQVAVSQSVPDRLRTFHALTRSRRSSRNFGGRALSRNDFDALLHTACGVTGTMAWAGREVHLRAYPSSGALYAVEIYPVVFRVEDLKPAVYHYRSIENVLEVVRPEIDPAFLVGAALPMEREMVAGAAALFCLTGCFPRHERKYGEGGYRMLVAECGHISQNLILTACALGLSARPFGGVFDGLLNGDLGLDQADEQFLLGVLVGDAPRAASAAFSS